MSDGRQPPPSDPGKEPPRPSWTERSLPEVVRPVSPIRPPHADDWDALVPAADPIVQAAYGRTGMLPVRPVMNRGEGGADALVIQKAAKQARVLNFNVDGIQWRAGFAPEIGQTPLGQYVPYGAPPENEVTGANGFLLRPIESELDAVLRDIVPPPLLRLEEEMFGKAAELERVYLYYTPHGNGATVGVLAWFTTSAGGRAHLLYLQTDVKRADPRIVDEMHKTFRASLVARTQHGQPPRPFDFWEEVQEANQNVETAIRNSSIGRNSGSVFDRFTGIRQIVETALDRGLRGTIERLSTWSAIAFIRIPQLLLAMLLRAISALAVNVIRFIDRVLPPQEPR